MPSYKLTYFNSKGRAELTRLLFAQAGIKYEDVRLEAPEWAKLKPTTPTGTLPMLEVDGKKISQSMAIARFVARQFKLAGSNYLEQALCEEIMETMVDMSNSLMPWFMEKDEAKKAELKKTSFEEKIKPKLQNLEDLLKSNGGKVFVGKSITIADLMLFAQADFLKLVNDDPLNGYPKLTALVAKVGKEPKIAAWVAKRPVTQM